MKHAIAGILAAAFLLGGEAALTYAQGGPNLLTNGSFEQAGEPSLAGWQPGNLDLVSFVSPGSPGGGEWALRLEADQAPTTGFVTQKVEGLHDGDIIELRADVKAADASGGGRIFLIIGSSPEADPANSAESSSGSWTTVSLVDTLQLAGDDSVWVRVSSFHTEVAPRVGLFDSVSLTLRGAVPVVPMTWGRVKARYR